MIWQLSAFAACAALTVAPAHASAIDCRLIMAMSRPGDAAIHGIQAQVDWRGRIAVRYHGKATSLSGATDCQLSGPADIFSLECNWSVGTSLESAKRKHFRLKAALSSCLSDPFALQDYKSTVEGLNVLDYFKGSYTAKDGMPIEVSLQIQHYADIDGTYSVILSISR